MMLNPRQISNTRVNDGTLKKIIVDVFGGSLFFEAEVGIIFFHAERGIRDAHESHAFGDLSKCHPCPSLPRCPWCPCCPCCAYTSDAADDLHSVDLGGGRICKNKRAPILSNNSIVI